MGTIGERLKTERLRLKYSQEAFGTAAGVGKHSQIRYESGERSPDGDYLAAIAKLGADVRFIVTGLPQAFIAEEGADYMTPALIAATEIAAMTFAAKDAELLLTVARHLNAKKT